MVLHAAENNDAVAGCLDLVAIQLESAADAKGSDLALDQPLARLRKGPLRLTNADRQRTAFGLAGLDHKLSEKMRFSRAPSAESCLVPGRRQQRLKDPGRRNFQSGQSWGGQ